jgi:hypothetical protein
MIASKDYPSIAEKFLKSTTCFKILLVLIGIHTLFYNFMYLNFMQDDAYIFLRYAKNFADGKGLVFNEGEHVEGFTSFLWTIILSAFLKVGIDPILSLKIMGTLGGLCAALAFTEFSRKFFYGHPIYILTSLYYSFYASLIIWTQSGLETALFNCFIICALYYSVGLLRAGGDKNLLRASIFWSLAILTRPEAPMLTAIVGLFLLIKSIKNKNLMPVFAFGGITFGVLATLYGFRILYFGDIFPNTYYAKGSGGIWLAKKGFSEMKSLLKYDANIFAIPAAMIGALFGITDRKNERMIGLMLVAYLSYYFKVGGDILPLHRLFSPGLIFVSLLLGSFFLWINDLKNILVKAETDFSKYIIWLIALLLLSTQAIFFNLKMWNTYRGFDCVIPALEKTHAWVADHIQKNHNPGDAVVLTDAGIASWRAMDLKVHDFLGLVDKRAARIFYDNNYNPWTYTYCDGDECKEARDKAFEQFRNYFAEINPRYVIFNLYTHENTPAQEMVRKYCVETPDSIYPSILGLISFDAYFSSFWDIERQKAYKPLYVTEYSPTFFIMLVEKRDSN